MKKLLFFVCVIIWIYPIFFACGSKGVKTDTPILDVQELTKNQPEINGTEVKEGDIDFTKPLDMSSATRGQATYDVKCKSCHRLTNEKLVGPGWEGVTKRRSPTWIVNMITNVDMMLEKDAEAQKLLEQCLVRMPNQNIALPEAKELIEFMRKNDGAK